MKEIVIVAAVFAISFGVVSSALETDEQKSQRVQRNQLAQAERAQEKSERAQEKAEENKKGFHCLSGWDGSHRDLAKRVKRGLREPNSFEHVSTAITPASSAGTHEVIMDYRGRNGFGGMNNGVAVAVIRSSDCGIVQIQMVG